MKKKSKMQSSEYIFPYHHIVDLEKKTFLKNLPWGLDYYNDISIILSLVRKYIKKDILDVGCGDGFLLYNLMKNNIKYINAVGIDLDEKPIKFAQAFSHGIKNVSFIKQDIFKFKKKFHLISVIEALEHIPNEIIENFVLKIDSLLLKNGILIISVPSKNIPVTKKHYRHYDIKMLQAYFPNYEILEKYFITYEKNKLYKLIEFLLCNNKINFNYSIFKSILFYFQNKFFTKVSQNQGLHIILVLKKNKK